MSNKVYQMVTDRIIQELESGNIPWRKPWTSCTLSSNVAYNRITRKPYSILNQMLLGQPGEYATYKQWTSVGGHVRKGEKSSFVVYWNMLDVEEKDDNGELQKKQIPFLRYYNVFHISQVDDVSPLEEESVQSDVNEFDLLTSAEEVLEAYVDREHLRFVESETSSEAYYSPTKDKVVVPCRSRHISINEFYSTAFHELVHSTGHHSRLGRLVECRDAAFASDEYSKEELIAEIGSATLLNFLGVETSETFKNSSGYIQGWLAALKSDTKLIVSASGKAAKAVDFILNQNITK